MDAVISAPENRRTRRARARLIGTASAVTAALVVSLIGAVPAQAADAIVAPDDLAITGDLRVGETLEISDENWTPADAALEVDWFIDDVLVDDETEAQDPLDLHVLPEWVGKSVSATVTATAADLEPLTVELDTAEPIAAGEWTMPAPEVSAAAVVGTSLTASVPGLPEGATLEYAWVLDGELIADAVDASYTPTAAQLGHELAVDVTATRTGYVTQTQRSAASIVAAGTFAASPLPTISGSVQVGSTLTAVAGAWSPEADLAYEWLVDGAVEGTETTFQPSAADRGKQLELRVTGTRDGFTSVVRTSAPVTVGYGTFSSPTLAIDGAVRVDSTLTALTGSWATGATLTYSWAVAGVVVSTDSSYTPPASTRGKALTLTVVAARDGYQPVTKTTASAVSGAGVFTSAPAPTISGTVRVDRTLTAVPGTWSPTATFTYSWKVDGKVVSTARTYKLPAAYRGKTLTLSVTASRAGFPTTTKSAAAVKIGYGAFTTASTPTIKGTTQVGSVLTASPGVWSPSATIRYQWLRNGVTISGATASAYRLTTSDAGKAISVKITASRTAYGTTSKVSAATAAITKPFTTSPAPVVSGTVRVGSTVTAKLGAWNPTATFTYQWKRSGTSIAGATASTYKLTAADYGKTISVTVSGRRSGYTTRTLTSASIVVAGPAATLTKPGLWQVGTQVKPGTYITNAQPGCYWERRSDDGSSEEGMIAYDFAFNAERMIVTISPTDAYFGFTPGCVSWTPYLGLGTPATTVGNGMHAVGVHILPGVYTTTTAKAGCYWEVVSGFGATIEEVLENDYYEAAPGPISVRIFEDDLGFRSIDCGTWKRVSD